MGYDEVNAVRLARPQGKKSDAVFFNMKFYLLD
jgi:hypothetical protein